MSSEWILRLVLFGIIHWILAGIFLQDLASRQQVFGGHKPPWVIIILVVPCFGSLLYLFFHPQILNPDSNQKKSRQNKREK